MTFTSDTARFPWVVIKWRRAWDDAFGGILADRTGEFATEAEANAHARWCGGEVVYDGPREMEVGDYD